MKKILFIIIIMFMLIGNVYGSTYVSSYYTVTNKCAVVKNNKAIIPVTVRIDNDKVKLSKLMKEIRIDYVTNYEDVIKFNIYGVNRDYMNVYVDYKRNSEGKSLVYFNIEEDKEFKRHDELVSFNIGVEILNNTTVNKMDILGNEVVLGDEKTCEIINGFKVTEVERIKYVDLSKVDHKEYIADLMTKSIIIVLSLALIVCLFLLARKKK